MLRWLRLILATWRLSTLLTLERGPYAVFKRLRDENADNEVGKALECFYCTSIWSAVLVLILEVVCPRLVDVLVMSAGAILYDKYTSD